MFLSEIPFDEIKLGTKVQGAISPGTVIKLAKTKQPNDQDGWEVTIKWEHSGREVPYVHWWMTDKLEVLEENATIARSARASRTRDKEDTGRVLAY